MRAGAQPRITPVRRGGIYVLVLSLSTITMSIGLIGMTALSAQREVGELSIDAAKAGVLAESAVQLAFERLDSNTSWRSTADGSIIASTTLGRGQFSASVFDPLDDDLTDDEDDRTTIVGDASVGNARQRLAVDVETTYDAISGLDYALVAKGGVHGSANIRITAFGFTTPFYLDDLLSLLSLNSTMEFVDIPPASIIDDFLTRAVAVSVDDSDRGRGEDYNELLLSATSVSGLTPINRNGVYHIDGNGGEVVVNHIQLAGTLVVTNTTQLTVTRARLLRPGTDGWPVLLADCDVILDDLSHHDHTDYPDTDDDPDGVDYDLDDFEGAQGLIYVNGNVIIRNDTNFYGTLMTTGSVTFEDDADLEQNDVYLTSPPPGYRENRRFGIVAQSWREVID